jgi:hypothetical protein
MRLIKKGCNFWGMSNFRLVFVFPILYSVIFILLFHFYFFDYVNGLKFIEEYVFLMIVIPDLLKFVLIIKVGILIDKENMGKYAYRVSKLQPIGLSMLSRKDVGILLLKHPIIKIWRGLIREVNLLLVLHVLYVVYVFFYS